MNYLYILISLLFLSLESTDLNKINTRANCDNEFLTLNEYNIICINDIKQNNIKKLPRYSSTTKKIVNKKIKKNIIKIDNKNISRTRSKKKIIKVDIDGNQNNMYYIENKNEGVYEINKFSENNNLYNDIYFKDDYYDEYDEVEDYDDY